MSAFLQSKCHRIPTTDGKAIVKQNLRNSGYVLSGHLAVIFIEPGSRHLGIRKEKASKIVRRHWVCLMTHGYLVGIML